MFRIHDILVWIRIHGSMPLTNGPGFGSGSCFSSLTFKTPTKIIKKSFSAFYILKVHLHNFSKVKVQKKSLSRRNQGFSYYFCLMIEGSGIHTYFWLLDPDPWSPKTCESGGSGTLIQTRWYSFSLLLISSHGSGSSIMRKDLSFKRSNFYEEHRVKILLAEIPWNNMSL